MKKLILEFSVDKKLQDPKLKFCYFFKNSIKVKSRNKNSNNIIFRLSGGGEIISRQDLDSKLDSNVLSISTELYFLFKQDNSTGQSEIRPIINNILDEVFKINNVLPIALNKHYEDIYRNELTDYGYEIFEEI